MWARGYWRAPAARSASAAASSRWRLAARRRPMRPRWPTCAPAWGGRGPLTRCRRRGWRTATARTRDEGVAVGMVSKVVDDAEVEAAAHELAMSLARGPTVTLGYIKKNINNAETMTLEACFDAEAMHHSRCSDTLDHKEAANAFV